MRIRVFLLLSVLVMLSVTASSEIAPVADQDLRLLPIPDAFISGEQGAKAACSMAKWTSPVYYYTPFLLGDEVVTYFDPTDMPPAGCGGVAYPYELLSVAFSLYDPGGTTWPVEVEVIIYDVQNGQPGSPIISENFICQASNFGYPNLGTVTFVSPQCLYYPFFLGIRYIGPGSGPFPSIMFDNPAAVVNEVWMTIADAGCAPGLYENFNCLSIGYPVMTVNGEAESPNCQSLYGVCCLWNGECVDNVLGNPVDIDSCSIMSDGTGVFSPGFTCGPDNYPCPLYDGSCCFPDASCVIAWTADECEQLSGGHGTFYPGIQCYQNHCCDSLCPNGKIITRTQLAGDKDNFAGYDPQIDQSSPDQDQLFWMSHCSAGPSQSFDVSLTNRCFGHTFTGFWNVNCGCIIEADLCLRLVAGNEMTSNDNLIIREDGYIVFAIPLSELHAYFGGSNTWNTGDVLSGCIELDKLPPTADWPTNIISALYDGDLDIMIQDDTGVDYLELKVKVCCDLCYSIGDVNGDGIGLSIADYLALVKFVYFLGPAPAQLYQADLNGDGYVDHSDIDIYSCYFTSGLSCFTDGYPVPVCCCPSAVRGACCEVDTCKVRAEVNCTGYYQGDDMPCCTPGDVDGSYVFNILDVTYLISYLYKGGPQALPYKLCSADVNCDCQVNILDITYLINYLYKGGPAPCTMRQWLLNCGCPLRK